MSTLVVVGAQWGDEGKGKVVDVLAEQADLVARFSGGNNAGHTLVVDGKKIITHLVPSGCTYPGTICLLGAGMVIDVDVMREEVAAIQAHGFLQGDELRVSLDAHVIFEYHRRLDGAREDASGNKIGTTRRGIGPAYEAKVTRRGIRVRDLLKPEGLRDLLELNRSRVEPELARYGDATPIDVEALLEAAKGWARWLEAMACDASALTHAYVQRGARVLFEGAQGALLDVDHGTYPYVTSTSTTAGGVCQGIGVGPTCIDAVWGITKAYVTRVGAGPFPTRLDGADGEAIRKAGNEFGATTGRPRDCGWLDLPALRLASRINGLTGLCVTKLDVLAELASVQICRRYADGWDPGRDGFAGARPIFEPVAGFGDPSMMPKVRAASTVAELPTPARAYLDLIEEEVGVPVTLIGTGPDRRQTIRTRDAF